jgi:hypothetical protein
MGIVDMFMLKFGTTIGARLVTEGFLDTGPEGVGVGVETVSPFD